MEPAHKRRPLWSTLKCLKWHARTWFQGRQVASCYGSIGRIYWVPASRIAAVSTLSGPPLAKRGTVSDGDWDTHAIPWDHFEPWIAFCHRYRNGGEWHDTAWYKSLLRKIHAGKLMYRCRDAADLDRHFAATEELCHTITRDGFRLQTELRPTGDFCEDEVTVHISRHGHYLLGDGRHRLCIARLLNLERVPVKVARRHSQWVNFRWQVVRCAERGLTIQPLSHPDLADIPTASAHQTLDLIKQHIPPRGSVIDFTAGWGYFCGQLEEAGFNCIAVEPLADNQYFLKRLHLAEQRSFKIIDNPYFVPDQPMACDAVLALNAASYFRWTEHGYPALLDLLRRVQTRLVFVQPHYPGDGRVTVQYVGYDPERFIDAVAEACSTPNRRAIGEDPPGNPIYMLWR